MRAELIPTFLSNAVVATPWPVNSLALSIIFALAVIGAPLPTTGIVVATSIGSLAIWRDRRTCDAVQTKGINVADRVPRHIAVDV